MLTATTWFALRPGFGTFALAFLAFLLWVWARFAEWLLGATIRLRKRIEEHLGLAAPLTVAPEKLSGDPQFRQLLDDFSGSLEAPELREEARRAMNQLTRLPEL